MSTDHPGRPFRYGIRFKIAVSIGVIMVALMAVDILWNLSLQNAQAENEAREKIPSEGGEFYDEEQRTRH